MKAEDYHKSLRPLEEACRLAGWVCLPVPLTGGKPTILCRHFALVLEIYKLCRQRILIREFSTLPLLLVFPLLWPLRKKLYFLINHNLQWAVRDPLERFGLTMLARLGARWALFETQDLPNLGEFNIPSPENLVTLHPVSQKASKPWKSEGPPVVGVAGYYRPEKGMDGLINLLKENLPEVEILLGVPNPEAAAHLDVETVSTASAENYFEMISRCDVLVFNGEEKSYFYRASGPVADAAVCGTAVVVPDFPVLGKQAAGIGEGFQSLEDVPGAVQTAVEKARAGQYDFQTYCDARSAQTLAENLKQFKNG